MSILVLYHTKYGSTKQYAQWIAQDLGAELSPVLAYDPQKLASVDTVIFGASIRMGKLQQADFLRKHSPILLQKKLIIFSVSAAPPEDPEIRTYYENSVPENLRRHATFVALPGRVTPLSALDNFLMLFPKTMTALKAFMTKDPKDIAIAEGIRKQFDHVNRAAIEPILRAAKV
jgi:menaquinone-dependent protoporphyrinogen IX oxidase